MASDEWLATLAQVAGVTVGADELRYWSVFNYFKGACANLTCRRVFRTIKPMPNMALIGTALHQTYVREVARLIGSRPARAGKEADRGTVGRSGARRALPRVRRRRACEGRRTVGGDVDRGRPVGAGRGPRRRRSRRHRGALDDVDRQVRPVVQLYLACTYDVDGDTATGRCELQELNVVADGSRAMLAGHYHDEYRRTPDGWRFTSRRLTKYYQGPADLLPHW